MAWKSELIKHFIEITCIGKNGKEYIHSQEYERGEYSSDIKINFSNDDTKLMIVPYTLERLVYPINIAGDNINELFAGIRDGKSITDIGLYFTSDGMRGINQYFFRDNQPNSFNFGRVSGPGWPTNMPALIDNKSKSYFDTLRKFRPAAAESIHRCVALLSVPGPEYSSKDNLGGIKISLKK